MVQIDTQPQPQRRETKLEKFIRIAESRATKAIKKIQLLEQLGNREVYDYDEPEIAALIGELRRSVDRVEKVLRSGGKATLKIFD
jgi:hypothetical protein